MEPDDSTARAPSDEFHELSQVGGFTAMLTPKSTSSVRLPLPGSTLTRGSLQADKAKPPKPSAVSSDPSRATANPRGSCPMLSWLSGNGSGGPPSDGSP